MGKHNKLELDDIHSLNARTYDDIAARDADTDFQDDVNIDKVVIVDDPLSYFVLASLDPTVWAASAMEGGNVTGPGSSTDNAIPRFNGTSGENIQNSGVTIDDNDNVFIPGELRVDKLLNVVEVYKVSDMPNTLVDGTLYRINAPLIFSNGEEKTFPAGSKIEITSTNVKSNTITYSGTGTFLNGGGNIIIFTSIEFIATSTGALFDLTGSGVASGISQNGGGWSGWIDLGTLTSFDAVSQQNMLIVDFDSGIIMNGVITYFSNNCLWANPSDSGTDFITFDDAITDLSMLSVSFLPQGTEHILNIDSNANVNAFINNILSVSAASLYFNPSGLDKTSPGVNVSDSSNIEDSTVTAELFLEGNTATTLIPAAGALVEPNLNVSWTSEDVERLTIDANGATTSDSLRPVKLKNDSNINLAPANASKSLSIRTVMAFPTSNTVTFTNSTNLINETATTLSNGDNISFRDTAGTLPSQIRKDIVYFVVNKLTNTFQISYTIGGSAISFTDNGTPVNAYKVSELHGSTPTNEISSSAPRDLIPQSTIPAVLNSKSFLVVINNDDTVSINVSSGYQRYIK